MGTTIPEKNAVLGKKQQKFCGREREILIAAYFYGIKRDDVDYIMETFPIVKRDDEKQHGEYRTKRVILEIYDEMLVIWAKSDQVSARSMINRHEG
ncbi:hypothetical protein KSC_070820 [Ktedonobacter sp. SOSP1-52]|nr:hypothetical protein [Ktedonobacter sp. SOSP1-52]GHO68190.1 hypothetical protein KSC_070820 [Ktedonobacter sp. SOSP1-52]